MDKADEEKEVEDNKAKLAEKKEEKKNKKQQSSKQKKAKKEESESEDERKGERRRDALHVCNGTHERTLAHTHTHDQWTIDAR